MTDSPKRQTIELEQLFQMEAAEHLNTMNRLLLALETAADMPREQYEATVRELFRVAHSIKGAARTVGKAEIEQIGHALEEVFEEFRRGTLALTPAAADILYDGLDAIEILLSGTGEVQQENLLSSLRGLTSTQPPKTTSTSTNIAVVTHEIEAVAPDAPVNRDETIRVGLGKLDTLLNETSNLLALHMNIEQRTDQLRVLRDKHRRWQKKWRSVQTAYIQLLRVAGNKPEALGVWTDLLEFLHDTQGYMQNSAQLIQQLEHTLRDDATALGLTTTALQSGVRAMRLLPFETLVAGFRRMVRDVARDLGKEVMFQTTGTHIELDRQVLEKIKDPVMHLLRNAIDHGIETPEIRGTVGKPPQGLILLSLVQRGSRVHLMVADDGRGVEAERTRRKAVTMGLISSEDADKLSESEIYELLLQPGMTTRDTVSEISGRGVGLDVVRQAVEALQGQMIIQSKPGDGTRFEITLPVSLSTLHCIMVAAGTGNEIYAIPSVAVIRVVNYHQDDEFSVTGQPMLTLDGQVVPVVFLTDLLERPSQENIVGQFALVLATAEKRLAVVVDDIISEQEVMVRNLNPEFSRVRNVSGATVLANGDVVIILNISDLMKTAQGRTIRRRQIAAPTPSAPPQRRILVVDDSITTRTLQKNILEAAGYEVITATHGVEALKKLETGPVELLISDVQMPWMDGFELTAQVRKHPQFKNLPIILVTSLDSQENKEMGFKSGADAYIVKGVFDQNELLQTIKSLLY
ncbi:MAG: hybrid sensor histidine kinase/response regulator [Chloroflexi bacterium]|nr:hybrid sensor histidine kinase/response regulator [Chloroflexota bacterium]